MRETEIKFTIHLDNQNVPEKIVWDATDKPEDGFEETKAIGISIWDAKQKGALRIDLWTNELEVGEMKRFCIESVGGMAETILGATGDKVMRDLMIDCVTKMAKHLEEEEKKEQN
jgi:gliding motility-associated protein GldC